MRDSLYDNYVRQIRKYPLLDAQREHDLSIKVQKGDTKALLSLIESNLRLVVSVANQYTSDKVRIMDLIQEGNIGLMTAAKKFNYTYRTRFSTYAYAWIQQTILRYIQNKMPFVSIPHRKNELLRNIKQAKLLLGQKLLREPTVSELSVYLGMDKEKIIDILSYDFTICGIDKKNDDGNEISVADFIPDYSFSPEKVIMEKEQARLLRKQIRKLPPLEYKVLYFRYNIGCDKTNWTLRKISMELGISTETVRQAEIRALSKLRIAVKLQAGNF